MKRIIALPVLVILLAHATSAMAQTIKTEGQLSGGNFVSSTTTYANGKFTGSGVLYGVNPSTGATYKYPFVITKGSTAQGKLILTGNIVGGPTMALTVAVPNGAQVFSYVVNGNTYSLPGQGTVLIQ